MPKGTVHFMGLLANVDSTILKVSLNYNFKVQGVDDNDGAILISYLARVPPIEVFRKLADLGCLNTSEKKIYFIYNYFEGDIETNDKGILTNFPDEVSRFDKEFVQNYLKPKIRLMRLFKQGNIFMPLTYYYFADGSVPKPIMSWSAFQPVPKEQFTLEESEIPNLLLYIQDAELPFTKPFLQLAFENFELSYQTHNINLSFLSLMISLETLFNPGSHEIRYRISRNTAVLLGEKEEDTRKIFSEMKKLYDKRSEIVHTGKSRIIDIEDLKKLRHYVRESIKEINKICLNKDDLMALLDSSGFVERVWRK